MLNEDDDEATKNETRNTFEFKWNYFPKKRNNFYEFINRTHIHGASTCSRVNTKWTHIYILHAFATRRRRQRNRNCQETNKTEKKMQIFEVNCVECVDVCVGMEWGRKVESKYTLSSNVETLLRRSFVRLWVRCCLSSKLTIQHLEIGDFNNIQRLHCVNLHICGMRNDNSPPATTATAINHPNNRNSIVESNLSMFRSAANRMRSKAIGDTWARRKYNIMSCINAIVCGVGAGRACVFLMVMFLLWTHKHINIACPARAYQD